MLWCFEEPRESLREAPSSFSPQLGWQSPTEQVQMQHSGEPVMTRGLTFSSHELEFKLGTEYSLGL